MKSYFNNTTTTATSSSSLTRFQSRNNNNNVATSARGGQYELVQTTNNLFTPSPSPSHGMSLRNLQFDCDLPEEQSNNSYNNNKITMTNTNLNSQQHNSMASIEISSVNNINNDNTIDCKANYEIIENTPSFSTSQSFCSSAAGAGATLSALVYEVASVQHKSIFFTVRNFNVLSGNLTLFNTNGIDIELKPGEILSIEGSSGIGKTRLLRALCQLDAPVSGVCAFINDEESSKSNPRWRRRCIYIPQVRIPVPVRVRFIFLMISVYMTY